MFWATVSSWSCFCWLYKTSPSLAPKNIINLILVLTIWWCPCVESSLVLLEEGVCYDQCVLLAELYSPLPCFIPFSKAKFACYSRCFLISYLAGGEGDDRGWDGWMASPTRWTCVWVNSVSLWWTGRPGVLWFMGSQGVRHDWATELYSTFAFQSPKWKGHPFWVLVLKALVGLHRTIQLRLLQHCWLGHRLRLPWYWMVCLGNKQRSFCHF